MDEFTLSKEAAATSGVALKPLSVREAAFVHELMLDNNQTRAYVRAGCSPNGAGEGACELAKRPHVRRAIEIARAQRAERVQVSADKVLAEMSLLANSSLEHYQIDDEGNVVLTDGAPMGAMRALASIKKKTKVHLDKEGMITGKDYDVEIKLWDKPTPLKLMGRHVGLFPNKVEHTGLGGGPLEIRAVSDKELAERLALAATEAKQLAGEIE